MLGGISGKIAVVTGGASSVGRGIAEALLGAGAKVVIADIEQAALTTTMRELDVPGIETDVTDFSSVKRLADEVVRLFGTVNIVVNNAGVGSGGAIADLTIDDWQWVLNVNLWGVIHGMKAFLPILLQDRLGGHIVNTASMSGLAPLPVLGAYSVAKSGVIALTEVLASEQRAQGNAIGVTALCLGPTRSNIANSSRNRPAASGATGLADFALTDSVEAPIPWKTPREIGATTLEAIRQNHLYLITHPEQFHRVEERFDLLRTAAARAAGRPETVV